MAAIDLLRTELLAIGPAAGEVIAVAGAHPGVPLLEGYAAPCGLFGQTAEGDALAARHLDRAEAAAGGATARERTFLAAGRSLLARRHAGAAGRLEALLADLVAAEARAPYSAFQSARIHFALARAGPEDELAAARPALEAALAGQDAAERAVWARVGLPLLDGVVAFARADVSGAADALDPIIGEVAKVGGSDAQGDLSRFTAVVALARAGRRSKAARLVQARTTSPVPTPLLDHFKGMC